MTGPKPCNRVTGSWHRIPTEQHGHRLSPPAPGDRAFLGRCARAGAARVARPSNCHSLGQKDPEDPSGDCRVWFVWPPPEAPATRCAPGQGHPPARDPQWQRRAGVEREFDARAGCVRATRWCSPPGINTPAILLARPSESPIPKGLATRLKARWAAILMSLQLTRFCSWPHQPIPLAIPQPRRQRTTTGAIRTSVFPLGHIENGGGVSFRIRSSPKSPAGC